MNTEAHAADRSAADGTAVEVLNGKRSHPFHPSALKFIAFFCLAAVALGISAARDTSVGASFDPVALLLRAAGLTFLLQSLAMAGTAWRVVERALFGHRYVLTLESESLLLTGPQGSFRTDRKEVLGIRTYGDWSEAAAPKSEVLLVTRPDTEPRFLRVPAVFGLPPGTLAERLMRWRGTDAPRGPIDPPDRAHPGPAELPSKVYDDAVQGHISEGSLAIPEGHHWWRRGPYATPLMAFVLLSTLARADLGANPAQLALAVAAFLVLVGVPVGWVALVRRAIAPRKGVALLLTPAALLIRTREGVHRAGYDSIGRVTVTSSRAWSMVEALHRTRHLAIERRGSPPIRVDEAFLSVPAEVVATLVDAYKTGALPV